MRKIAVITGSRAEYGLLRPVMDEIRRARDLKLQVIVTGSHLSQAYGYTVKEIEADGFKVSVRVPLPLKSDSGYDMAVYAGVAVSGLAACLKKLAPDCVVILGDRGEALAGAIAAAYMGIPIAHIFGGDQCLGGDLDDSIRHAITKFSHLHFAATKEHAKRIERLGEEKWRIHTTGSPGLDAILRQEYPSLARVADFFKVNPNQPIIVLLQHPVGIQSDEGAAQMKESLEAFKALPYQTIVIYPPADKGSGRIIQLIDKYNKVPHFRVCKNVPHDMFLGLLKYSRVMAGNSSSGIIEAPSFKLPVVNIGIRQLGRARSTNIIDVGHKRQAISKAVKKALFDKTFLTRVKAGRNPYGDGCASTRIVKILKSTQSSDRLLQKQLTY